jgi:hypothetical protein
LKKVGLAEVVEKRQDNVSNGGPTSEKLTEFYLKQLPPKLYEQLVNIYRIDLDLFGYKDLPLN